MYKPALAVLATTAAVGTTIAFAALQKAEAASLDSSQGEHVVRHLATGATQEGFFGGRSRGIGGPSIKTEVVDKETDIKWPLRLAMMPGDGSAGGDVPLEAGWRSLLEPGAGSIEWRKDIGEWKVSAEPVPNYDARGPWKSRDAGFKWAARTLLSEDFATGHVIGSLGRTITPKQKSGGSTSDAAPQPDPPAINGLGPGDTLTYNSVNLTDTVSIYILTPKAEKGFYRVGEFQLNTTSYGTVFAFCVDLPTPLDLKGGTYTAEPALSALKLTTTQIGEVGALLVHAPVLIGDAADEPYGSAKDIAAALQLAIWDVEYASEGFAFRAPPIIRSDYNLFLYDAQNVWPAFDNYLALVDPGNQTLITLPEPSTWAMTLLGFAGLGFASLRAHTRAKARVAG